MINIKTFFKEVYTEGRKVDWPTRKETIRYTVIILSICATTAIFLGVLDLIFLKVLGKFII